jgi:hypothetical protein
LVRDALVYKAIFRDRHTLAQLAAEKRGLTSVVAVHPELRRERLEPRLTATPALRSSVGRAYSGVPAKLSCPPVFILASSIVFDDNVAIRKEASWFAGSFLRSHFGRG